MLKAREFVLVSSGWVYKLSNKNLFFVKENMIRESRGGSFWKVWWGETIGKFDEKYPSYIYIIYIYIYPKDPGMP